MVFGRCVTGRVELQMERDSECKSGNWRVDTFCDLFLGDFRSRKVVVTLAHSVFYEAFLVTISFYGMSWVFGCSNFTLSIV